MAKTSTGKRPPQKPKPEKKWQTGDYDRYPEYKFILPYQFLLLCRLLNITPEQVITDFLNNLSCGTWKREGRDKVKEHLLNYFMGHGYGQDIYTEEDIRQMFKEMDALGMLFPKNGKSKIIDVYAKWRKKHYNYWFKKWFSKPRRKLSKEDAP